MAGTAAAEPAGSRSGPAPTPHSGSPVGLERVTDALVVAALAAFAALAVVFRTTVTGWVGLAAGCAAAALVYSAASAIARRTRNDGHHFLLRAGAVAGALAFLYAAVAPLQLVLRGRFLDAELAAFEERLLGVQPVLSLERFTSPLVTEWMMLCYVGYLALFPLVFWALWTRRGDGLAEPCLLALVVANLACSAGFVLLPVAGPGFSLAGSFTVPLDGFGFTWLGELMRERLQYPGASLPSPHCAVATVLWVFAWRSRRGLALALAPFVLSLYAATVYGRYHFLSDSLAGIVTGLAALAVAGWVAKRAAADVPGTGGAAIRRGSPPRAARR